MNCEHMQENLYDYLDDSLSPSEKAAAEKHLAGCAACAELVRREAQFAHSLSGGLEQAVANVALDAVAQRNMAGMLERKTSATREHASVSFWSRFALPFAAAVVILFVAFGLKHHFTAGQNSHLLTSVPLPANGDVLVHISYCAPAYTFRKEGNLVIDALTCDAQVTDGALIANN
jgi:anti-sigma factor RsiW